MPNCADSSPRPCGETQVAQADWTNDEPRIADARSRVPHHYGGYEADATAGFLSIIMDTIWTCNQQSFLQTPESRLLEGSLNRLTGL